MTAQTGYSMPPWLKKDPWTGVGREAVWGFSPAIDFLEVVPNDVLQGDEEVTVLMTGASDCRHILKTLAKARKHTSKPIRFIIHETNLRTYGRHLMFLQFLLELNENDNMDDAAFTFLELFGNAKVRTETQSWLRSAAQKIAKFLCDGEGVLAQFVETKDMKARERDWVEEQVQWWKSDKVNFDIDKAWDTRKRLDLGDRYDCQKNMIDWDFHMNLVDLGPFIKFPEYKYFRNDAISFDKDLIDPSKDPNDRANYEHVNRTLLHFDRKGKAYYAGDIKNGPFSCFGVETENKQIIIKQQDNTYRFGAGVPAFHNVRAWLYEFVTGREWVWMNHVFQWDQTEAKMAEIRKECAIKNPMQKGPPIDWKASFCTLELETMVKRWHHQKKTLHLAYIGVMAGAYFQGWLLDRIQQKGHLIVETAKFVLELNDEQRKAYIEKLDTMADDNGWTRDRFYQRVLHLAQLEEEVPQGSTAEAKATRRARLAYPNCCIYTRPAATKADSEMKMLEDKIAQQKIADKEAEEEAKKIRMAQFDKDEEERLAKVAARRKAEEEAESDEDEEADTNGDTPADPSPKAPSPKIKLHDGGTGLLGTGLLANHLEEIDD